MERIEFRISVGRCRRCRRRVQGRHPRQTSDALGSTASQLRPRALALTTQLNKGLGLPYGKTATVLQQAFGSQVSRGGLCQALARVASKSEPTYNALVEEIRRSASVTPDETGWRVGGKLWWMWAFSTPQVTVYSIQPGRGFERAAMVLGADFAGFLVRDGWSIYRQFIHALHQTCLARLLRSCREMLLVARTGEAEFPRTIETILQQSLQLRDRHAQGQISEHGVAVARGRLEVRMDRTLANSGYMFAVTGNIIEDMETRGVFKNYFFRNGMTVSVKRGVNGGDEELSFDAQKTLAMTPNENIVQISIWQDAILEYAPQSIRFPISQRRSTDDDENHLELRSS